MTPEEAKAHADRYPAEWRPNPDYVYRPPREVVIDGVKCVEMDAGILALGKWGKPECK